ncbi:MAG: hypothetical protein HOC27_03995 [Phycisphaerae bacterium]|jgi:hypothetical protein|nr:hypothetical protein [Phycisphaerae bacterium]
MSKITLALLSLIACISLGGQVFADYLTISSSDGTYDMYAGDFNGLLGSSDHQFSMSDLDILAGTLNNDGIETVGQLTFILASTDAGMSFIGLFDGIPINDPIGSTPNQFLGVSATTSTNTDWFASGDSGSQTDWYDLGNGTQLVNSYLGWDHGQTSAGFAWGNVEEARSGTVSLYDIDLTEFAGEPIQFVTFQDSHWDVAGSADFSLMGQYAFSYQFVPAPGAIALLTIAGLTGKRRRRK